MKTDFKRLFIENTPSIILEIPILQNVTLFLSYSAYYYISFFKYTFHKHLKMSECFRISHQNMCNGAQKTYPSPQVILWCCGGALDIYWFLLSADYRHRKSVHYHFRRKYWAYIFVRWKKWCFGLFLLQIPITTFVIVAKYLKL